MLCSDGIIDYLRDNQIETILASSNFDDIIPNIIKFQNEQYEKALKEYNTSLNQNLLQPKIDNTTLTVIKYSH